MIDSKLITLLMVNELHSFTQAAKKLSLTQPAVSQHVRQLEKELGVTIFARGEGNLKLTREGEIVIKYAKRIDSLYQNLEQSLKEEKEHARKITVGITHTSESNIMVEVLARYSSVSKKTRITIISDTINNLYMKLKTYEIDLAIVEGRISDSNFNTIMLDTDSLILAVSNKNPLSRKSMVTLNELRKENLILRLPDSGTRNLFISHLESNNVSLDEFNVILEVDNVATIKDLVRRDFGVSILARSACANELKKGKLIGLPIENLSMTREINMVYHKDFEHMDLLQNIMRIYNEYSLSNPHSVDTPGQLLYDTKRSDKIRQRGPFYDIFDACVRSGDRAAAVHAFRVPYHAADVHVSGAVFLYNVIMLFYFIFLQVFL